MSANSRWLLLIAFVIAVSLILYRSTSADQYKATTAYKNIQARIQTAPKQATECFADELRYENIERTVLRDWRNSWIKKDIATFNNLFVASSPVGSMGTLASSPSRNIEGIAEYPWQHSATSFASYLSAFDEIADLTFATQAITIEESATPTIQLWVRFDIRGNISQNVETNSVAGLRTDRGILKVSVEKVDEGLKISNIEMVSGESLISHRNPGFVDVTKEIGLGDVPITLRTEAIRRGGYALSVGNLLGDNKKEIYVGSHDKGTLWQIGNNGTFEPLHNYPFTNDTLVKTAIFADFSNSGNPDALLVRFAERHDLSDLAFYKNNGSQKYSALPHFIARQPWSFGYAMPATAADFNNDGLLDFYVGFPGKRDFTALGESDIISSNTAVQGLFLNMNNDSFRDASDALGAISPTSTRQQLLYPHSAMAVDVNQDGNQDIVVMDDRGNLGPVYKNGGNANFTQVAEEIGLGLNNVGMGVAAADTMKSGKMDFAMTYVNFAAADRLSNLCGSNIPENLAGLTGGGIRLFRNTGNGTFADVTKQAGLSWAGEGVGGVEFIDYNNDGYPDIYVSNGLWSGTSRIDDASGLFTMGVFNNGIPDEINRDTLNPVGWMDFLVNFKGNLATGAYVNSGTRPSMAGYQHNRLFRNNGDGTYTEVGFLEGVDSIADGYIAARMDINDDGKTDLVLRNADPGSYDHIYPVIQVFENKTIGGHSITLHLVGNPKNGSNIDAIGAEVTLETGGQKMYQQLLANNGPSQSERVLTFGLGSLTRASKITVRFPSGVVKTLTNVPAGTISVDED